MKFPAIVIIIILLISSFSIATAQEKVIVGHSARAALSIGPLLYGIERGFYRDEGIDLALAQVAEGGLGLRGKIPGFIRKR